MKTRMKLAALMVGCGIVLQASCVARWFGDLLGDALWLRGID